MTISPSSPVSAGGPAATSRLSVVGASLADAGGLASAASGLGAGAPVIGILCVQADGRPRVAPGTPESITLPGTGLRGVVAATLDGALADRQGFEGGHGQTLVVLGSTSGDVPTVVFVGCGAADAVDGNVLRRAAATFARVTAKGAVGVLVLPAQSASAAGGVVVAAQAMTEGAILATYRFVSHKSDPSPSSPAGLVVAGASVDASELSEGIRRGTAVAEAVCFARDLVNQPPSSLTPRALAEAVQGFLDGRPGVSLEIWDEARIEDEHLGGLLAVARGSAEPPRLLLASYDPSAAGASPAGGGGQKSGGDTRIPHLVLVGKGITFDSGGLSLKSGEGMMTMKTDMGGAAAVMAALGACAELGVRARITAIAPVTENMPSGTAQKPGDVLTVRDGQTIEVLNTDAEGRLVLADGLTLARELNPDA
ncbi:MAG: leucyl aminopeptidase family protein, partial [Acidimicrobiales bacterium]